MTKTWGPLGWATLHSIAALYPQQPTELEKELVTKWMQNFNRCIVCENCRMHYSTLLKDYMQQYPNWNATQRDLSLFVLRAHNIVNKQTGKPIETLENSINLLRANVPEDRAALMRQSYIVYIQKQWSRDISLNGITSLRLLQELILAERQYWCQRSFSWDTIAESLQNENIAPVTPGAAPIVRRAQATPFKLNSPRVRMSFVSR